MSMGINVSRGGIRGEEKMTRGCVESVSRGDLLGQVYFNNCGMSILAQYQRINCEHQQEVRQVISKYLINKNKLETARTFIRYSLLNLR